MVSQIAHLPAIANCTSLKTAAIADIDLVLANKVAKRFGNPLTYPSHSQLLKSDEINALVIVTHRHLTQRLVREALDSGKHVLSEKPMAMTLAKAQELVDVAKREKLIYAIGFMKRYDAGVARAKATIEQLTTSQRLGRLIHVRGKNFCAEYVGHCEDYICGDHKPTAVKPQTTDPTHPEWLRPDLVRSYDWLANVGLHSFNLLRYLLAHDLTLRHAALHADTGASVQLSACDAPISLDLGRAATGKWEESFEFFFERGRLELQLTSLKQRDRCAAVTLDENLGEAKTTHWGHDTAEPWSFTRQMQAFAEAINGHPDALLATAEDSLADMVLLENIFRFVQENKHG